jgi:maltose O-acetyltransferase
MRWSHCSMGKYTAIFIRKMKTLGGILRNPEAFIFQELQASYCKQVFKGYCKVYDIHPSVQLGDGTIFYGGGEITMGEGSYTGRYCLVDAAACCKVKIGSHCAISHFVAIYTENRKADQDFTENIEIEQGDVIIGDYCWIGYGAFIKQGVTIGRNCVIGAHSVVINDIPDYSIAVGAPAKVVKTISHNKNDKKE